MAARSAMQRALWGKWDRRAGEGDGKPCELSKDAERGGWDTVRERIASKKEALLDAVLIIFFLYLPIEDVIQRLLELL